MARNGIGKIMIDKILKLKNSGFGIKRIARELNLSKNTVKKTIKNYNAVKLEQENEYILTADELFFERIKTALENKNTTIKQLQLEWAPDVNYFTFYARYKNYIKKKYQPSEKATIIKHFAPAEVAEVDYTDGFYVKLNQNNESFTPQLFVMVSSFSGKIFAEFSHSQITEQFIKSHINAFEYFKGVFKIIVSDNLKPAVIKPNRVAPIINPKYEELSKHYDFVTAPARVRKPRDKARVEATIGVIQRSIYPVLKAKSYQSISDLNRALLVEINKLNDTIMKDYGESRNVRFEREAEELRALPVESFDLVEIKEAKVQTNSHVQVFHNFYSVPSSLIGFSVNIHIGINTIKIFTKEADLIATHPRMDQYKKKKYCYSTLPQHQVENFKLSIESTIEKIKNEAGKISSEMKSVIETLANNQLSYRMIPKMRGIIRIAYSKHTSIEAINYACKKAIEHQVLSPKFIQGAAEQYDKKMFFLESKPPKRRCETLCLHQNQQTIKGE